MTTIEEAIEAGSEYFQIANPMGIVPHTSHQVDTVNKPKGEEQSDKQEKVSTSPTGRQPNELTALVKVLDEMINRLKRLERYQPTNKPEDRDLEL